MNLNGQNILVMGLGKSGAACARFLVSKGAYVTVTDRNSMENLAQFAGGLLDLGVRLVLDEHPEEIFEDADLIVLSPGVPHTLPPLLRAAERGVPVIGEIELAARFISESVVAITGTNGKTTVTELTGEMLRASGFSVFVGGNIGTPLLDYVTKGEKADRLVIEVSSFQLDTIKTFKPCAAVLLNITEDHMDRYPDFAAYARSKGRIFENQGPDDSAVINGMDSWARDVSREIQARKYFFSTEDGNMPGAFICPDSIRIRMADGAETVISLSRTALTGVHNRENIAAAALAVLAAGGTPEGVQTALDRFRGLPHRLEYVDTINGVRYFDDSKATNTDAVVRALESFSEPVILIMGGRGKGYDFGVLAEPVRKHVRRLITIGETAQQIADELGPACPEGAYIAGSMEAAVAAAFDTAVSGEAVLLSPACASFDMYSGYARRGEHFCNIVRQLKG